MIINDVGMRVRSAMPHMRMIVRQIFVGVLQNLSFALWPEHQRPGQTDRRQNGKRDKGGGGPGNGHQPTGQRIGHEPAGMRQRELGSIDCGPVLGMGRAFKQSSRRREDG